MGVVEIQSSELAPLELGTWPLELNEKVELPVKRKFRSVCSYGCTAIHIFVFAIPLNQSVLEANDPVSIMRDVVFVRDHDNSVGLVMKFLEQVHDVVRRF